jgi:hypothetical protein
VALLVGATAVVLASSGEDSQRADSDLGGRSQTPPLSSDAHWRGLAALPEASASPTDAALATVGPTLYALIVTQLSPTESRARVWSYDGDHWTGPLGGEFTVDADYPVQLIGGETLCTGYSHSYTPVVRCLRGGSWSDLAGQVYPKRGPYIGIADLFDSHGAKYVVLNETENARDSGDLTVKGRAAEKLLSPDHGRWTEVPAGEPFPASTQSQRAQGFELRGKPCLVADEFSRTKRGSVRAKCISDGRWRSIAPGLTGGARTGYSSDGVTVVDGHLFIGTDQYTSRGIDWPTFQLEHGRWNRIPLGRNSTRWDEQGELYSYRHQVLAIRFDQQRTRRGLLAKIEVDAFDPRSGSTRRLGKPLVRPGVLFSTVAIDLASTDTDLFALYTVPNSATHNNEVRVSRLAR